MTWRLFGEDDEFTENLPTFEQYAIPGALEYRARMRKVEQDLRDLHDAVEALRAIGMLGGQ